MTLQEETTDGEVLISNVSCITFSTVSWCSYKFQAAQCRLGQIIIFPLCRSTKLKKTLLAFVCVQEEKRGKKQRKKRY